MHQRRSTMAATLSTRLQPIAVFIMLLVMTGVVGWLAATRATGAALPPPSLAPVAPTSPSTPQSGPPILVSHVTWQGRPAQPNNLQRLPLTLTLELSGTAFLYPNLLTDASGSFTVTLGSLAPGTYNWWVKGPQYLAKGGVVQLGGAPVTNAEMGTLQVGDASADNLVDIADFGIVRASFGKSMGDTGYDQRADFNGDNTVDIVDFSLLRGNFGGFGPPAPPDAAPPDPSTVAPPIDMSVATDLGAATEFLYTGPSPIQTGMISGTIEITRVAVLRGKVLDRAGEPLPAATIKVLGHPEYGQTYSRADGMFDMAVNGGGLLTVEYAKGGYLPVQRDVQVPWKDYEWLPDVALIPLDPNVTTIQMPSNTPMQVARGSVISDIDGIRQATLLFPISTTAVMTLPNNVTQTLTTLHVRATEYTVGENGPEAMPGDLPANSAYTYSPEFSVDEAVAAGAMGVGFSQPILSYLENFLDFPVGGIAPVGYYDRARGDWVPSDNGRVIRIISIVGGLAELDTDGDGQVDNGTALGVTATERQALASLYPAGQSLWRVPMTHFTPYDINWPMGLPDGALPPNGASPFAPQSAVDCKTDGSIIGCHSQTLGEAVGVTGSEFGLHYSSDRVPGRRAENTLDIPLSAATVPTNLLHIDLFVEVAGRTFTETFPAAPNQRTTFTWDGQDAYGRTLQGQQPVTVRIGYVYGGVYAEPGTLGRAFAAYSATGVRMIDNRIRDELTITLWQDWVGAIGAWDGWSQGLGGWSLSAHHTYDPGGRTLYQGDGGRRTANSEVMGLVITRTAGGGNPPDGVGDGGPATQAQLHTPDGVDVGPDGSLYIADAIGFRIRRVRPDGIITTVAGDGQGPGYSGDGGPATQARVNQPWGVVVAPDDSFYFSDAYNHRIRYVGRDGIITTVAGNGGLCGDMRPCGDGGPAVQAQLHLPAGIDLGPDGSLYIADYRSHRIRRVGPDGIITTVAGTGYTGSSGDGGPAIQAAMYLPRDVAVGPDGSLYIAQYGWPADWTNGGIRRVTPDGIITTVPGTWPGYWVWGPTSVDVGPDGSLYYSDHSNRRIRRVGPEGIITTVAGNGTEGYSGDGGPATRAQVSGVLAVALGPDGSLYIGDNGVGRIRRVTPAMVGSSIGEILIPAEDGSEVYIFNSSGRHLRTLDALTGTLRYQFSYDGAGRLTAVTDGDGNVTSMERDPQGNPTAIVAPDGQRTTLALNPNGYLSRITNPAGEWVGLEYTPDGLLTTLTDPRSGLHHYAYDSRGRLIRDENPAGGVKTLARVDGPNAYTVTLTTLMTGTATYNTTYRVERLPTGDQRLVNTLPGGQHTETLLRTDGTRTMTETNGTVMTQTLGPDPRWGMLAPLVTDLSIRTPGGLVSTQTSNRTVRLANPNDLFSLQALTDTVTLNGQTYTSRYDAATRTITDISAAGRQSVITLNARGYVVRTEAPGLAPSIIGYDSRGRVISTTVGTGAGEHASSLLYNSAGYVSTITDAIGSRLGFGYDAAGRVLTQTLADGRVIRFAYDTAGNLTTLRPPERPPHSFTYTPADQTQDYIPPEVGAGTNQTHYRYNLDKQVRRIERPDGAAIQMGYDGAGRINAITHPGGTMGMTYDPATGNLMQVTAPGGVTTTYAYDGDMPLGTTWAGTIAGTVSRTFDNTFRIATESVNGGHTINFQYDQDNLLTGAGSLTLSRNSQNGLLTGTTLGSTTDTLSYNGFGEVAGYSAVVSGTNLLAAQYTHDWLGRISERTETTNGVTHTYSYTYDLAERLTDVRRDGALVAHYEWDANGNRLSVTRPGSTITGTYDLQDRLLQYGTTAYSYTANGDLLSKVEQGQVAPGGSSGKSGVKTSGQTTYSYDVLGNLKAATLPDGTQIEYIVDGQNRRIGKKVNGTLVQGFLYRGQLTPAAELDGAGNVISRFVYASRGHVPDSMVKNGVTYRIISDHVGNPRLVVNTATGQVVQRMDYDEFGNILTDTNPGFQPFGFAGGLYDQDTKLTRFGARDYDAETGRWTAKDPIGFTGGDTNLYGYVVNDPINLIDPSGLILGGIRKALGDAANWTVDNVVEPASNAAAGFGDGATFGLTNQVREGLGVNDAVDKCSDLYVAGQAVGRGTVDAAIGLRFGGAAGSARPGWIKEVVEIAPHLRYDPLLIRLGSTAGSARRSIMNRVITPHVVALELYRNRVVAPLVRLLVR